jgi:hypothetical protein
VHPLDLGQSRRSRRPSRREAPAMRAMKMSDSSADASGQTVGWLSRRRNLATPVAFWFWRSGAGPVDAFRPAPELSAEQMRLSDASPIRRAKPDDPADRAAQLLNR